MLDKKDPFALAAYNQNFENFRALNALMWQIPLIAMTLTGGLWFGVSKSDGVPGFRLGLLSLATVGNIGLIVILERVRFVMTANLKWISEAYPRGAINPVGDKWSNKSETVKRVFQLILFFAAFISAVLLVGTMMSPLSHKTKTAVAYYDAHAEQLADGYEAVDSRRAHPELFKMLQGQPELRILDVGAGTGRDTSALADLGHRVTAVEPSAKMLDLARALHASSRVNWIKDSLPTLSAVPGQYDLVLLSAVWMHVPPEDRSAAFTRIADLTLPGGRIYLTLRKGPEDSARAIWAVEDREVRALASAQGMTITDLGILPDLMGRSDVAWQTLVATKPKSKAKTAVSPNPSRD